MEQIKSLRYLILELLQYDKEWIDFISKSRIDGYETDFDIIYDRMADSQYFEIADALQDYTEREITAEDVINRIKWHGFDADQYCFKSEKAVSLLYNKKLIVQCRDEAATYIYAIRNYQIRAN